MKKKKITQVFERAKRNNGQILIYKMKEKNY